ncbi:MAG TPA: RnfABCDGE type electron transport complex subunit G [Candidatus Omnitrophota bacterium]|nr:RnfABCDGE type electron transport complex subunit G [Candidatus Omnitrophota bacterium]
MKTIVNHGLILGMICLVATGLLATVDKATRPRIEAQARLELENSLKDVLPEAVSFEPVTAPENNTLLYYKGLDAARALIGVAFTAQGKGYSSMIETMVGMKPDGTITAIKVLNQNETPGLGSQINEVKTDVTILDVFKGKKPDTARKPWFTEQFSQKEATGLEGVQSITGATISSGAVIDSVKQKSRQIKELLTHG